MMQTSRLLLVVLGLLLTGCELVADFDRGKIPVDASVAPDSAAPPDTPADEDAGAEDAGP